MPSDDLVINVKQIASYPSVASALSGDAMLLQRGGLGGPYQSISPEAVVATALASGGGPLQCGVASPANSGPDGLFANWMSMAANGTLAWNAYGYAPNLWATYATGQQSAAFHFSTGANGFVFYVAPSQSAGQQITWGQVANLDVTGYLTVANQVLLSRDPTAALEAATMQWVNASIAAQLNNWQNVYQTATVWSFNNRAGNILLTIQDLMMAGGAPINSPNFTGCATAPIPPAYSNDNTIATTSFVNVMASWYVQQALATLTAGSPTVEAVTVTAANVLAPLSRTVTLMLFVAVNGQVFFGVGSTPAFTVSGAQITWTSAIYGVNPGDAVVACYY